jgi:hypothetical protein
LCDAGLRARLGSSLLQVPLPTPPRAQPARRPLFRSLYLFVRAPCHRRRGLHVGVRRMLLCMHPRARAPTHSHTHARRGKTAPFCPFTAPSRARRCSARRETGHCRRGGLSASGVLRPGRHCVCAHDRAQASREPRDRGNPSRSTGAPISPLRRVAHPHAFAAPFHSCLCLRACGHTRVHRENASHRQR